MSPLHLVLALVTVATWGLNFVLAKIGVAHVPPLLFTALRFFFTAIPLVFFVPRPAVPVALWLPWGLIQFALQFGLLYAGIAHGMGAGLTSLVSQVQVFFFIGLSVLMFAERPGLGQLAGAIISFSGIVLVGCFLDSGASAIGFCLVLGASATWAVANVMTKKMGSIDPLALVTWGALAAVPPLILASFIIEGQARWQLAWQQVTPGTIATILYQAYPNTLFGYTVWSLLVRRYPSAVTAPIALLIPVFGMAAGVVLLGEAMPWWKWLASSLVLGGLILNQWTSSKSRASVTA